jgi:hypothetical protein
MEDEEKVEKSREDLMDEEEIEELKKKKPPKFIERGESIIEEILKRNS